MTCYSFTVNALYVFLYIYYWVYDDFLCNFYNFQHYILFFKCVFIYLKEELQRGRETHTQRETFSLCWFTLQITVNSQGWTRPKSGSGSFFPISSEGAEIQGLGPCFPLFSQEQKQETVLQMDQLNQPLYLMATLHLEA